MIAQRASGCLFGMAFGDALGADTEFSSVAEIIRKYPPSGPQEIKGDPARVTDDSQMALAVGRALLSAERPYTAATLTRPLRDEFVRWLNDPENNRAPGSTCLKACHALEAGKPWLQASQQGSKGCGANMRVQAVGVLPAGEDRLTEQTRAAIAQLQAAITHGHPTALAAADLTARAIADLMAGGDAQGLPKRLWDYAHSQRTVYHGDWLGSLWQRPYIESPEQFIALGWDECLTALDRLDEALIKPDRSADPCLMTGGGWVAEQALATGLLCFLLFPNDPVAAIRRAVVSCGDSDSIACLTGAFVGAYHGLQAWPSDWQQRIEYRDDLVRMGDAWDR